MIKVYEILGVSPTVTDEELKKAYKKLAIMYHPDKCGGDDTKMSQLNEAYALVSTPEARKKYDESNAFTAEFDMLATVFGKPTVAQNFGKKPETNQACMKKGTDIALTVNIPVDVFACGMVGMPVRIKRHKECLECSGTGAKKLHKCPNCGGYGQLKVNGRNRKCSKCGGLGFIVDEKCPECGGKCESIKEDLMFIKYNAWTTKTSVENGGNDGVHGGERGDLNITYNVMPVDGFYYDPSDESIHGTIKMYPEDVVLGVETTVKFGKFTSHFSLKPADMKHLPIVVSHNGGKYKFDVEFIGTETTEPFQEIRNTRMNDII